MIAEAIIDASEVKLNANVVSSPFKHFYCEDVFPIGFYNEMLDNLPNDSAYTDRTFVKTNRIMANLKNIGSHFWKDVDDVFTSRDFVDKVCDIFPTLWDCRKIRPVIRLIRDRSGYTIPPHTDVRSKAVTIMFYLPPDDSLREYGTTVLAPKDNLMSSDGNKQYKMDEFNEVKTAPFIPNASFGFLRSDRSFHCVKPIGDVVRNQLLFNIEVPA